MTKDVFKSGYVALIGAPNAGKSTLLNQILKEKVSITSPKPQTTRNRILGILTDGASQVVFIDTPGIHKARDRMNRIMVETALTTLGEVDAVAFLIDATEPGRETDRFIIENLSRTQTPVILVINKIDLVKNKPDLLPVIQRYSEALEFKAVVPVCALSGEGVGALLGEIQKLLPEGPSYYPEDQFTDKPERFLVAELIREKIFRLIHQEVPYAIAVTVDRFVERTDGKDLIDIEATIHVERDSQKAIVIGKKGMMLKEIGKQARKDIEALLGCRVFLGLFVRVQKEWRRDARALDEFGYGGNE